jgi:hypothetical protein
MKYLSELKGFLQRDIAHIFTCHGKETCARLKKAFMKSYFMGYDPLVTVQSFYEETRPGHLRPKLEVPGLTCPGRESNPGLQSGWQALYRKEPFEQRVYSYSEHLRMSARTVENSRDTTFYILFHSFF